MCQAALPAFFASWPNQYHYIQLLALGQVLPTSLSAANLSIAVNIDCKQTLNFKAKLLGS